MTTCPHDEALAALLAGSLEPARAEVLRIHLGACAACRERWEGLEEAWAAPDASEALEGRVRESLQALIPRRRHALPLAAAAILLAVALAWKLSPAAPKAPATPSPPVASDNSGVRLLGLGETATVERKALVWIATGGEAVLAPGARLGLDADGVVVLERGAAWLDLSTRKGARVRIGDFFLEADRARFWASVTSAPVSLSWLDDASAAEPVCIMVGLHEGNLTLPGRVLQPGEVAVRGPGGAWSFRPETPEERMAWQAPAAPGWSETPGLLNAVAEDAGWRLAPAPAAFAHLLWAAPARPYAVSAVWTPESGADAGVVWHWQGRTHFWVPLGQIPGRSVQASVVASGREAAGFLDGRRIWQLSAEMKPQGHLDYAVPGAGVASRGCLRVDRAEVRLLGEDR